MKYNGEHLRFHPGMDCPCREVKMAFGSLPLTPALALAQGGHGHRWYHRVLPPGSALAACMYSSWDKYPQTGAISRNPACPSSTFAVPHQRNSVSYPTGFDQTRSGSP
jgi:hypothetical protein